MKLPRMMRENEGVGKREESTKNDERKMRELGNERKPPRMMRREGGRNETRGSNPI